MTPRGMPLPDPPSPGFRFPGPASAPDVVVGRAADVARRELAGFGPGRLLSDVSVARAAGFLMESCREPVGWVRVLLSGLEEFRQAQRSRRLSPALSAGWSAPARADGALVDFALQFGDAGPHELSRLAFGPKVWFTVNGVPVTWRPLPGSLTVPHTPSGLPLSELDRYRAAGRSLLRAGVTSCELVRLRLGDLGRLAPGGVFVPDLLADPLLVRVGAPGQADARGPGWLVPLGHEARIAVLTAVLIRYGPDAACRHGGEPFLPFGDDVLLAAELV